MHVDRPQGAGVHEDERAAIVEVEHRTSEPRRRRPRLGQHPIAVHPEVGVENATVFEVQQLVLASALDASDAGTDECPKLLRIETATQRRVQHAHAHDRATTRARAQHFESGFYFR